MGQYELPPCPEYLLSLVVAYWMGLLLALCRGTQLGTEGNRAYFSFYSYFSLFSSSITWGGRARHVPRAQPKGKSARTTGEGQYFTLVGGWEVVSFAAASAFCQLPTSLPSSVMHMASTGNVCQRIQGILGIVVF